MPNQNKLRRYRQHLRPARICVRDDTNKQCDIPETITPPSFPQKTSNMGNTKSTPQSPQTPPQEGRSSAGNGTGNSSITQRSQIQPPLEESNEFDLSAVSPGNAFYNQGELVKALEATGTKEVVIKNTIVTNYAQVGPNNSISVGATEDESGSWRNRPSTRQDNLSKRMRSMLETTNNLLKDLDTGVITPSRRALEYCEQLLSENGHVTITGRSGHGKTTLGRLLLILSDRQPIIINDIDDWKHVKVEAKSIILIDDIFGKHSCDATLKNEWMRHYDGLKANFKSGKLQMIITSRVDIVSHWRHELGNYIFFHQNNIVDLSNPKMELDCDEKEILLEKYLYSEYAASHITLREANGTEACKVDQETGIDQLHITRQTIKDIVKTETYLGFPQCARHFVSDLKCFHRGVDFFKRPIQYIRSDIEKLRTSENDTELFEYCTLVIVLLNGKLTISDIYDKQDKLKAIADSCRVPNSKPLYSNIRNMAEKLTCNYLDFFKLRGSYKFKHNCILETVFMTVFDSDPNLIIEYCDFNLIKDMLDTYAPTEDFGSIVPKYCYPQLFGRVENEILKGNLKSVVSCKFMFDQAFVKEFCSNLKLSEKMDKVLTIEDTSPFCKEEFPFLCWATYTGNVTLVDQLIKSVEAGDGLRCIKNALKIACSNGKDKVFEQLLKYSGSPFDKNWLVEAAVSGNAGIIRALVQRNICSDTAIKYAIREACHWGKYDVYIELINLPGVSVVFQLLEAACFSGCVKIVEDLLRRRFFSKDDVLKLMITVVKRGDFTMYKVLVTSPSIHLKAGFLDITPISNPTFLQNLLDNNLVNGRCIHKAFVNAILLGNYEIYKILLCFSEVKYLEPHLVPAVESGSVGIVGDLLSRHTFTNATIRHAMLAACKRGQYNLYQMILSHRKVNPCSNCLVFAAESGSRVIVADLLERFTFNFWTRKDALSRACTYGQYEVYKELLLKTNAKPKNTWITSAAKSGSSDIVIDLLKRETWPVRVILILLREACKYCKHDMYSAVMHHMTEQTLEDDILRYVAVGGCLVFLRDVLKRQSWNETILAEIMQISCKNGRFDIYSELTRFPCIKINGKMLVCAVQSNCLNIVKDLLLRIPPQDKQKCVTEALKAACADGRYNIFQEMSSLIDTHVIDELLGLALKNNRFSIASDLLKMKYEGANRHLDDLVKLACQKGRYDIYNKLLRRCHMPIRDAWLISAVESGCSAIVDDLLHRCSFNKKVLGIAVAKTILYSRHDLYSKIISRGGVDIQDEWLAHAAQAGITAIVADLVTRRSYTAVTLDLAIKEACGQCKYDMYKVLISQPNPGIDKGRLMVIAACSNDGERIITDLLDHQLHYTYLVTQK
ncbi:hypothetical protein ScPMuIL_007697 [Solemya velum]